MQRSTARSRDVTGDGWPDVIARQPDVSGGALWAYTHSTRVQGTATFSAKTLVGTGWNVHNWVGVAEVTGDTPEFETTSEAPADLLARRADGALMVYPHSGVFNGTSTWRPAVIVGLGWNIFEGMGVGDINTDGFEDILAWDNDQLNLFVYFHSGTFNGTATFRPALLLGEGGNPQGEWNMLTDWSRENPDIAGGINLDIGNVTALRHTNKFNGVDTWDRSNPWLVSTGQFTRATTLCIFLMDVNGDGLDDMVKSMPNGYLTYYPFRGWGASPGLGTPVQIGAGWHTMDLIT